jgi:hypothetical protein
LTSDFASVGRITRSAKIAHVESNTSALDLIPNIVQSALGATTISLPSRDIARRSAFLG